MSEQKSLDLEVPGDSWENASDRSPGTHWPSDGNREFFTDWFGLVTSHRRLFDACQDGWLRPLTDSSVFLEDKGFVSEPFPDGKNVIPVQLTFDVGKLPFSGTLEHEVCDTAENDHGAKSRRVRWCAPIPMHAVWQVKVAHFEHRDRLLAMASQLSNVSLPVAEVDVTDFVVPSTIEDDPVSEEVQGLELPGTLNAVQGAMAMAVWSIPPVQAWIEILQRSLNLDVTGADGGLRSLGVQWLIAPWLVPDRLTPACCEDGIQKHLWQAALRCMQWNAAGSSSPGTNAERIAKDACLDGANLKKVDAWLDQTQRLFSSDETITCDDWQQFGAGRAIQLVLLRPDPMSFRFWNKTLPGGLPPAVWWAAAMLCGWHHGYKALDKKFRGDARLQELLAIGALKAASDGRSEMDLSASLQSSIECRSGNGSFSLIWRDRSIVRIPWRSRAWWHAANLTDDAVNLAAQGVADELAWPCLERWLMLPEGALPTHGNGRLSVDGESLLIEGTKRLRLPDTACIDERIDPDLFRRCLATEVGRVPDLPAKFLTSGVAEIPGLIYRMGFIGEDEEADLVAWVDQAEWSLEIKRRVQHFGWRYDYERRKIDASMQVRQLPEWAKRLGQRLVDEGLMEDLPDQAIVNEYQGSQGIRAHIDKTDSFTGQIATISLLETWGMKFKRSDRKKIVEIPLERRSVAVISGDARYKWTHEIPVRKSEPSHDSSRKRVKRNRRISLTFRKVLPDQTV